MAFTTPNLNTISNGLLSLNINQQQQQSIILIAKFDYQSKESNELDLKKNERLLLIDNSKNWWLVRKLDNDQTGYVPSNYVKKEKKSLLEKIIPRKLQQITSNSNQNHSLDTAITQPTQQQKISNLSQTSPSVNKIEYNNTGLTRAIVKHKYVASKSDELSLNIGVKVIVLEKFGDGWWKIAADDNQSQIIGLYPSNYLQEDVFSSNLSTSLNKTIKNSPSNESNNQTSPKPLDNSNNNLDSSYPKCESISSNEKEIEYLRVIYPYHKSLTDNKNTSSFNNKLSVCLNEIVKLVEDDHECLDYEKSWIKVFNSQGLTGMIPSKCVEPILDNQLSDFVFIRRPSCIGLLANNKWYFGNITRYETILLLNKYAANGDYLVRDSDSGDYSISLKSDNINNKHFKVFYKDSKFLIGKKLFTSMQELLDHYHKNPIFDQNGEKLYLIKPFEPPAFELVLMNK